MSASSRHAHREHFAILLLLALLVRPRDCSLAGPPVVPAPALSVREQVGRLERADPKDWSDHTTAAAAAEGPPHCWWSIDEAMLGLAGLPPAGAKKLVAHMESGGLPDAKSLREQARVARPQAEQWSRLFRTRCSGRDLARAVLP